MKTGKSLLLLALLLVVCSAALTAALGARVQDETDLGQQFVEGKLKYEDLDFEGAVAQMTAVIDAIAPKLVAGESLDAAEETYYSQALVYRALANLDMANEEDAKADFRRLIQFAPGFHLSEDLAAQLYLDLFASIKKEMVGNLLVTTDPAGAEIKIDNVVEATAGAEPIPLLAGKHRIAVGIKGYRTEEREIEIFPGETSELSLMLTRTTASVFLRTSPPGAEVLLDGEVVGATSGTAGEDYADQLAELGLPADQVSAEFALEYVELGTHQLTVRMRCFAPQQRMLDVKRADDLWLKGPIVLEPSKGSLVLKGVPSEAEVSLNGEKQERGRLRFDDLCSGPYSIEVRFAGGSFAADAVVSKDLVTEVEVQLKPVLVYVGAVFGDLADTDKREWARARIRELIGGISCFRVIGPDDEELSRLAAEDLFAVSDFAPLGGEASTTDRVPDRIYRKAREVMREVGANLLAVAVYRRSRLGLEFRIHLLGTIGPYDDSFIVDLNDPKQIEEAEARLNYRFTAERSWLGITAVDTLLREGAAVIAVQPGSPAGEAGVEVGEAISAVGGQPVSGYRDVREAMHLKQPGEKLELELQRAGVTTGKTIVLGRSPKLLPLFSHNFCYNAVIASMNLTAALNPGSDLEQLSLLNTGLALAHFGAWEDAITYLRRVNLGDRPGINQGTVEYFLGIFFERLGYRAEALGHFRRALEFETATLDSNDGPPVAPLVKQKVKQLEGAS